MEFVYGYVDFDAGVNARGHISINQGYKRLIVARHRLVLRKIQAGGGEDSAILAANPQKDNIIGRMAKDNQHRKESW